MSLGREPGGPPVGGPSTGDLPGIDGDTWERVAAAAGAAGEKMGQDILVLDVSPVLAITDAFVMVSGTNARQVRTIAEEVEAAVKRAGGGGPLRSEGLDDARWVLLDFGDFVVHVFLEEARRYYDLERLWSDVPRISWDDWPGQDGRVAGD